MSANDRLGNGSLRSGPTLVMFMPGMLGNVPGGSPAPTGVDPGEWAPRRRRRRGRLTGDAGGGTSIGGMVSAGGLNGFDGR